MDELRKHTFYQELNPILLQVTNADADEKFQTCVVPLLIAIWANDYASRQPDCELLEASVSGFSYLFDVRSERLVAAWGISKGKNHQPRAEIKKRMKGHPLKDGGRYHRGHAIPHTLGGQTDINLVPQLGKINSGPFQALERKAVSSPGALYFSYWLYGVGDSQKPVNVEQGLLCPGAPACTFDLSKMFQN
jgi:hypothetical protein